MLPGLPPELIAGIALVIVVAGAVNGLAGFGFALVGTMALATAIDPATAVVFMIAPILGVNLSLIRDLSLEDLRTCGRRFTPLILAALVGTVVGLVVLDRLPQGPLKVGLGAVSLAFVASAQRVVPVPGLDRAKEGCFVESIPGMIGVGAVSGLLFGGTNVGVQLIAYLRSCDLSHGVFVGVVAMVFLGLNAVRIGAAGALGLYPSLAIALASAVAVIPAVAGVAVGKRLRTSVGKRQRRAGVLGLLTLIGIRLILGGLGIA
ncbi:sulfite exporter TauE/SafE family protein [Halapricum hydrolyticum]|uniref:Probable membrane transporter protein n=1 Tax=Halapricum hydrolyticum TaxID=2979991 RepID=A0AAE3I9A8_9EURY|nr:sulfite exporter TauE/SafE family protein [Halapricum hydrolyticum]MCU4717030.1 sulfite exporter TauE/SafE family protein [Halapricum hydrolyticum]MCU4725364.1 sulfite exporter TauE/SafE family protein [Halapricum hydrolyticum]